MQDLEIKISLVHTPFHNNAFACPVNFVPITSFLGVVAFQALLLRFELQVSLHLTTFLVHHHI